MSDFQPQCCVICAQELEPSRSGPPRLYCSSRCKTVAQCARMKAKTPIERRVGAIASCFCCKKQFSKKASHQKFCSRKCAWSFNHSGGLACKVRFQPCPKCCNNLVTVHGKGRIDKLCRDCRRETDRRKNSRKNMRRRSSGELTVTIQELAARDGERCQICMRRLNVFLPGSHQLGPTFDHILPVSRGGTNDAENLRLAHRRCNSRRGNKLDAQMLLEVV